VHAHAPTMTACAGPPIIWFLLHFSFNFKPLPWLNHVACVCVFETWTYKI
jgi:hypothetical protein